MQPVQEQKSISELTIYLKAVGLYLPPEQICYLSSLVEERVQRGHNVLRHYVCTQGGNHADDVAIAWAFALRIHAKEGVDWDWSLDIDHYHFNIGFNPTVTGKRLLEKIEAYHDAQRKAIELEMATE